MAQYNIEMSSYNGASYDQLYPKTLLANVSDWNNSIYSKSEVYSKEESYSKSNLYTKAEVDSQITNTIDAYIPELDLNKYKEITKVESLRGNKVTITSLKNFNDFSSLAILFDNILISDTDYITCNFLNTGSAYTSGLINNIGVSGGGPEILFLNISIVNNFWIGLGSRLKTVSPDSWEVAGEWVNSVNSLEISIRNTSCFFQSGTVTIYGY